MTLTEKKAVISLNRINWLAFLAESMFTMR